MSYINQFFDAVKGIFGMNANKVVIIGLNEEKQIMTVGAGDLQTAEALVMIATAAANTYLEMSDESKAGYSEDDMLRDISNVVRSRIAKFSASHPIDVAQEQPVTIKHDPDSTLVPATKHKPRPKAKAVVDDVVQPVKRTRKKKESTDVK